MTLKKAGLVVAGVLVALMAVAPIASATETTHGHDGTHGHGKVCAFHGGHAGAGSDISGDSLANAVAQAPIGGNNIGNIGNCSEFLNDNGNGNLSGNTIPILSSLL